MEKLLCKKEEMGINFCVLWRYVHSATKNYFLLPEAKSEVVQGAVFYYKGVAGFFDVDQVGEGKINVQLYKTTAIQQAQKLVESSLKYCYETVRTEGELYSCFSVKTNGGHVAALSGLTEKAVKVCLLAGLHKYLLLDDCFVRDFLHGDSYKIFMRVRGEM